MDAGEFQLASARTLLLEPEKPLTGTEHMVTWCALGLAGESAEVLAALAKPAEASELIRAAGEACELVKKQAFYGQGLKPQRLAPVLARVLEDHNLLEGPVSQVMDEALPQVDEDTHLHDILRLLQSKPAILVEEFRRIIGIITRHDVLDLPLGQR